MAKAKTKKIAKAAAVKKAARKTSAPGTSARVSARKPAVHKAATPKPSPHKPSTPLSAAAKPAAVTSSRPAARGVAQPAPRADLPPTTGFTLLVDGHFKGGFDTLKQAKAAAAELKDRFPMLRLEIYDAAKKARVPV